MKKLLGFVYLILANFLAFNALALPEKFLEVSPGVYRSAQPSKVDIKALKAFGIKTILNLNNDENVMAAERRAAEINGINLIEHPMSGFWSPDVAQVERSLDLLNDPSNYPILVHCKHGEDRTGLIIGLHRVYAEGWEPEAAYDEMLELGFHRSLVYLDRYFKSVTGFDD